MSMEYLRIEQKNANKAKKILLHLKLFDGSRAVQHSRSYVYFPIVDIKDAKAKKPLVGLGGALISRKEQDKSDKNSFEERIKHILDKKEIGLLAKGYDQLGNIAIIEFDGKRGKEKKIANALMQSNKSITTVLAKEGAVSGKYRIRKVRYIAGTKTYIANYRENGCLFRFDVRKVFFSNRLSFERSRILSLVKNGENVMVMFAGVGPFAIEIGKVMKRSKVLGIEANKFGYRYMQENIKLNKTANVTAVLGDVRKVSHNYRNFADRIIMPLPWSSLEFLDEVYAVAKKRAIVHLYAFTDTKNAFENVYTAIKKHSQRKKYSISMLDRRIVRPYSKAESEIVIDYKMTKT